MKHVVPFLLCALLGLANALAQDTTEETSQPTANSTAELAAEVVDDPAAESPLDQLAWMIGQWVDEGDSSRITTHCSWTKNNKFLTRSFAVSLDDLVTLEGTQVIGWDPIAAQIRSWTFDSEGGFGQGRWIRDGDRWLVKTTFVLPDGARASAINVYTYVDQDTFRWQSLAREIAGELQPSIPEVVVVRQTAEPEEATEEVPQ